MKKIKTNAMRILDKEKIDYELKSYPLDGLEAAVDVPTYIGITRNQLFKTLVTTDTRGGYYVFVISSAEELDLKKAAAAIGVKKIEMLKQKDLLPLTGYIHGGCTAVGMKKAFPTWIDAQILNWDKVVVSAGKVGFLIAIKPQALIDVVKANVVDVIK